MTSLRLEPFQVGGIEIQIENVSVFSITCHYELIKNPCVSQINIANNKSFDFLM